MSLLSVGAARAQISTSMTDAELQAVIDREEAYLSRRIGQLVGPRDDLLIVVEPYQILHLRRPTDSVVVKDADDTVVSGTEVISDGWRVWRPASDWPSTGALRGGRRLTLTYTPNDEREVTRVILELVRGTSGLSAGDTTGLQSETIGSYSYSMADQSAVMSARSRYALVRGLMPPGRPTSVRLRSLPVDPFAVGAEA